MWGSSSLPTRRCRLYRAMVPRVLHCKPLDKMLAQATLLSLLPVALASGAACAAPFNGQLVFSKDCSVVPNSRMGFSWLKSPTWDANMGGQLLLNGTSLCMTVSNTTTPTGSGPAITVETCDSSRKAQVFSPASGGGNSPGVWYNHVDGNCLDLVSGSEGPNEQLETYGCSGNPNQVYVLSATTGLLTVDAWGFCIGACSS